jgi:hypothetical protein
MDISILGYKLNLEILILIGVVYLILVGHTFCGCCNFGMMEGMTTSSTTTPSTTTPSTTANANKEKRIAERQKIRQNVKANLATQSAAGGPTTATPQTSTTTEGFTGANTNYGQSSPYDLSSDMQVNTSSWSAQNMTVSPGQPLSAGVKQFLAREPQPVPLPEGEMLLFANTPFKPECCPNTFSTGSGCACMTGQQYNYLILRGGNNVPYSEY